MTDNLQIASDKHEEAVWEVQKKLELEERQKQDIQLQAEEDALTICKYNIIIKDKERLKRTEKCMIDAQILVNGSEKLHKLYNNTLN